jgi:hypothetical protein
MLSVKMNDVAVRAVGVLAGLAAAEPPGGLAPGLRDRAAGGIVRRGEVLTWAGSSGAARPGGPAAWVRLPAALRGCGGGPARILPSLRAVGQDGHQAACHLVPETGAVAGS